MRAGLARCLSNLFQGWGTPWLATSAAPSLARKESCVETYLGAVACVCGAKADGGCTRTWLRPWILGLPLLIVRVGSQDETLQSEGCVAAIELHEGSCRAPLIS